MKVKVKRELNIEELRLMREAIQKRIDSRYDLSFSFLDQTAHYPVAAAFSMFFTLPAEIVMNIRNKRDEKRIEKIDKLVILYQNRHKEKTKVKCKCRI